MKDHGTHTVETLAQEKLDGKKYPGLGTREDPFIVDWDVDDPENPYNWSKSKKWLITLQVCQHISVTTESCLQETCLVGSGDFHSLFL